MDWIMHMIGQRGKNDVKSIVFICISDTNCTEHDDMKTALARKKIETYEGEQPKYGILGAAKLFKGLTRDQ